MPVGSGAIYLANKPPNPYVPDAALFNKLTSPAIFNDPEKKAWPGFGKTVRFTLAEEGIVSEIRVYFEGVVAGEAAGVADPLWAYRLVDIKLGGTGKSDIQESSGMFYHALRFVKNAALQRNTEFYGAAPDENGAFRVLWVIPVAADPVSNAGSIWTQSDSQTITVRLDTATGAELGFTAGGAAITGDFWIEEKAFEVPWHPTQPGSVVIPDLSRLHGIITRPKELNATGRHAAPIFRAQATLMRLFIYTDMGSATGAANPVDYTKVLPEVERQVFKFGARTEPFDFDPAWGLVARNSEHYGAPLPKGWDVLDLVKENGPRDVAVLPAMTDPEWLSYIRAGTALANGARVELVEEVMYVKS